MSLLSIFLIFSPTSNVCIKFGLIVSFISTASAPPTPYKGNKVNILRLGLIGWKNHLANM